jgi:hypothetical protein
MAFYDHQGTYASSLGVATAPASVSGTRPATATELLNAVSPLGAPDAGKSWPAAPDAAARLRFRPTEEVTADVRRSVVASMARHAGGRRAALEAEFARADVVGEYRRMIARHGYDPLDLGHNVAAFLILQWETATGHTVTAPQMRGTARQVERVLGTAGAVAGMSDGDKQAVADALAYQALLGVEVARRLRASGDAAALARLREGVHRTQRALGWDFERLALGPEGFVPRHEGSDRGALRPGVGR